MNTLYIRDWNMMKYVTIQYNVASFIHATGCSENIVRFEGQEIVLDSVVITKTNQAEWLYRWYTYIYGHLVCSQSIL